MTLKTSPWKPGEYSRTPGDAIACIEAALEEVGPEGIKGRPARPSRLRAAQALTFT